MRFSSPPASSRRRAATYPRGFHSRVTVPPQRFSRSRGLESARPLPALFHAGPAPGVVCLSRSFSPGRAVRPLGRRYPLAVDRRARNAHRSSFRVLVPARVPVSTGFHRFGQRPPLAFRLPEVFSCSPWGDMRPALLDFTADAPRWVGCCPSEPAGRSSRLDSREPASLYEVLSPLRQLRERELLELPFR